METRKLEKAMWDKVPVESNRGFNVHVHLTEFLRQIFPGFEFGFFVKDDLEHRRTNEGYEPLSLEYWNDVQQWNEKVAFRHGMHPETVTGLIMQDKNYICLRPIEWGNRRREQISREENERYQAARRGKAAMIKDRAPDGVSVGSSLVETVNVVPPEVFHEPDIPSEDLKGMDVFTNVNTGGSLQVTVDIPKQPEKPAVVVPEKKKAGRPKGSKNKK